MVRKKLIAKRTKAEQTLEGVLLRAVNAHMVAQRRRARESRSARVTVVGPAMEKTENVTGHEV